MKNLLIFLSFFFIFSQNIFGQTFSANSKYLVEFDEKKINVWDIEKKEIKHSWSYQETLKLEKIKSIPVLSPDGNFVLIIGWGERKDYKKVKSLTTYQTVNLKTGELGLDYFNTSRKTRTILYASHPTKNEFFQIKESHKKKKYFASIQRRNFEDKGKSMESTEIERKKKDDAYRADMGKIFLINNGTELLLVDKKSALAFNPDNLEAKPQKKKIKGKYTKIKALSNDATTALTYYDDEVKVVSTSKKVSKNLDLPRYDYLNDYVFIEGTDQMHIKTSDKMITIDYVKNEVIQSRELKGPTTFTPDGKYYFSQDGEQELISQSTDGNVLFTFYDDDQRIRDLAKALEANELDKAGVLVKALQKNSGTNKEFLNLSLQYHYQIKDYATAKVVIESLGKNLNETDYLKSARAMAMAGDLTTAIKHLVHHQKFDIRLLATELQEDEELKPLATNDDFITLVKRTATLDAYEGTEPLQSLFDAEVGFYELYYKKAYYLLNQNGEVGLEKALNNAAQAFTNATHYALTPAYESRCHSAYAQACLKAEMYVQALDSYIAAINIDPTVSMNHLEAATVSLAIKNIITSELAPIKQVAWSNALRKDAIKVNDLAQEYLDAFIAKNPGVAFAYFQRAQTYFWLTFDNKKKRMRDAKRALQLYKEQSAQAPHYCQQLADATFGYRTKRSGAINRDPTCNTNCKSCRGQGISQKSKQCTSCNGKGHGGPCYGCNGRGRKYDTTRNAQCCQTCYGKGKLQCYLCNSSGKQSNYGSCEICRGSGYDCK